MFNPLMSLAHSWEDRGGLLEFLSHQLLLGRVALFLGSGVSVPFGLPPWEELIGRMYRSVGALPPGGMDLARQAEVFLLTHCRRDNDAYLAAVKTALYENVTVDLWTHQPFLAAVGALVMSSKRGSASSIVTFNFDDILEAYLEFHGFVAASIVDNKHWADNADVRIYHPHGLLPYRPGVVSTKKITLDQSSFDVAQGDQELWDEQLLAIMRSHICLFIGLSGSDPHLEKLLQKCRRDHVSQADGLAFWGVRFTDSGDASWRALWGERGVATWVVGNYERDLPLFLLEVCQGAAKRRALTF